MCPGVEIDARTVDGTTPLMIACGSALTEVCEVLMARGADINAVDARGSSVLWWACVFSPPEIALKLIAAGANVNAGTEKPLRISHMEYPEMAAVKAALIARGATPRRTSRKSRRNVRKSRKTRKTRKTSR